MRNGKREGHGILVEKNGFVSYEGYWENDQPSGYGVRKYSKTGDRHEGDYVAGKREGCGVYLWANGDKYKGDWKQGISAYQYCKHKNFEGLVT